MLFIGKPVGWDGGWFLKHGVMLSDQDVHEHYREQIIEGGEVFVRDSHSGYVMFRVVLVLDEKAEYKIAACP